MNVLSLGYRRSGRQFEEDEVYVGHHTTTSTTAQQGKQASAVGRVAGRPPGLLILTDCITLL